MSLSSDRLSVRSAALVAWRRDALTLTVAAALGLALMEALSAFEWTWLRGVVASAAASGANRVGLNARACGETVYVGQRAFEVTFTCTYVDLDICVLPMLLIPMSGLAVLRVVLFVVLMSLLSVARIIVAIVAFCDGASWDLAHGVPDAVLWYGVLIGGAGAAWRRLRTLTC